MSRERSDRPTSHDSEDERQNDDGEGFLSRWSRRKHQSAQKPSDHGGAESAEADAAGSQQDDQKADQAHAAGAELESETTEPAPPGDEDMPPLDSIDQGGGVRDFFSPNVSKKLRGAALKRLFSQPEFSAPDLLEEYAGDYSKPEPLGDVVTAEMRYRAEQALKFAERKLKETEAREGSQQLADGTGLAAEDADQADLIAENDRAAASDEDDAHMRTAQSDESADPDTAASDQDKKPT